MKERKERGHKCRFLIIGGRYTFQKWHKSRVLLIGGTNVALAETSVGEKSVGKTSRHPNKVIIRFLK
jgi:hypothetical protein